MRWIHVKDGKVLKGDGAPPDGDIAFVDSEGSLAYVGGVLYLNGVPADAGAHEVVVGETSVFFSVGKKGDKASRHAELPVGLTLKARHGKPDKPKGGGKHGDDT